MIINPDRQRNVDQNCMSMQDSNPECKMKTSNCCQPNRICSRLWTLPQKNEWYWKFRVIPIWWSGCTLSCSAIKRREEGRGGNGWAKRTENSFELDVTSQRDSRSPEETSTMRERGNGIERMGTWGGNETAGRRDWNRDRIKKESPGELTVHKSERKNGKFHLKLYDTRETSLDRIDGFRIILENV